MYITMVNTQQRHLFNRQTFIVTVLFVKTKKRLTIMSLDIFTKPHIAALQKFHQPFRIRVRFVPDLLTVANRFFEILLFFPLI